MTEIVHVGPNLLPIPPKRGGAIERRMWALARAQLAQGANASIVAVASSEGPASGLPEVAVIADSDRGRFALKAGRRIAAQDPDVVHIHSRPEIAFALRAFGYKGAIVLSFDYPLMLPGIAHRIGGGGYRRGLATAMLRVIDLFLPVSHYAVTAYRDFGGELPSGRWEVLWNGTECPPTAPGQQPQPPVALFVGRFVPQKGADLFAAASERLPDWDFVAAGPRGEFHVAQDDTAGGSNGIGRVRHLGALSDEEVAELMYAATCLVLPTRAWEVFGMVLIEALSVGTPVVASDAGGPKEVLAGCPAVHFFPVGDLERLVESIEESASDTITDRSAGQRFVHRFCWDEIARASFGAYDRARALRSSRRQVPSPIHGSVDPIETSTHTESTPGVLITRLGQGYVQPSLLAWRVREAALYRVPDDAIALDLGAGYGHFTHAVAPRAIAVDLALDQLQAGLAAGNYRAAVCADISALPFRPGSAETVLSNCVLEHLVDLPGALRELRRTLTPAGSLQTTVPLAAINDAYIIPSERYRALRNRQLAHRTLEDSAGWRRLFASAGLEVKHETTAVTEGEARRWDALDAPLFAGVRGKTAFGGYVRILDRYPRLRRLNRRLAARMAAWILGGRRGSDDPPVCAFFDLRPNEPM